MIKPSGIRNMHRQVYDQLRNNIIQDVWKPGEAIPGASDLARELGVSLFSIRRALKRLTALGLLETGRGGLRVRRLQNTLFAGSIFPYLAFEQSTILQILEYRWIVEKGSASLAAQNADSADIQELEKAFRKMESSQDDREAFARHDLEFHLVLAKATHNPIIFKVNSSIKSILEASIMRLVSCLGVNDGIFYHEQILQAVRDHDREKAEKWMEDHIARTIRRYIEKNGPKLDEG